MITFIAVLCIMGTAACVYGLHLVHQDNQIKNATVEYEWIEDNLTEDQERYATLTDSDGDIVLIYPRHLSDDFLENWEAEWNREVTRIRFEEIMHQNEIKATFAQWQLEIEKGVNFSASRTV